MPKAIRMWLACPTPLQAMSSPTRKIQETHAVVRYRCIPTGWDQYINEKEFLTIEDDWPSVLNQIPQSLRYLESMA